MNPYRLRTAGALELVLRDYDMSRDGAFVHDSWIRSAHRTEPARRIPWRIWQAMQREHVQRCLRRAPCFLLVHPDAPDEIVGWCCAEGREGRLVVHWIYVVRTLRKLGAAHAMLDWLAGYLCGSTFRGLVDRSTVDARGNPEDPHVFATQAWARSSRGDWIGEKVRGLGFDPYLVGDYVAGAAA